MKDFFSRDARKLRVSNGITEKWDQCIELGIFGIDSPSARREIDN